MLCDNDTFERADHTFHVTFPFDDSNRKPWEECEGHGPVSEWTTRDKAPGELVLCEDRGYKRFYDYQAAVKLAKHDRWNSPPYKTGTRL